MRPYHLPVRCLDNGSRHLSRHRQNPAGANRPPPIRLGRRRVYDRVDLDRWLDNHKSRGRAIKEELWPEKKDSTEGKTAVLVGQDRPRRRTPGMEKYSA